MKYFLLIAIALGGIGCASASRNESADTACQAECLVCKKNADLACVKVNVNEQTPKFTYNGKTYYFCSEDCRDEFAKRPEKYVHGN